MSHAHQHHGPIALNRAFALGVALNLGFVAVEAAVGVWSGSLALLADAGHNLSDVLGLLLAWGALFLTQRQRSARHTYGYRRSSILAALLNAVLLLLAIGSLGWEAIGRLNDPAPVAGGMVMLIAALGVAINTGTALLFMRGRERDLNVRGAFLHMAADAGVSLGVVLAGGVILATGWAWLDPVVSLLILSVILIGTWGLLRDSVDLALDAVPSGIDSRAVERYLAALPGVTHVHDLHIWALSTTETALTAHVVKPDASTDDRLLCRATQELHDRFGIEHTTLQWERQPTICSGCAEPIRV